MQLEHAAASCDQALAIKPDYAEAHCNRGNMLHDLRQLGDAIASYDKATAVNHDIVEAWCGRGRSQHQLGCVQASIREFRQALDFGGDRDLILYELAELGAEEAPPATPGRLLTSIFDGYA